MRFFRLLPFWIAILIATVLRPASAGELTTLKYITESYPPYNFQENGKLHGIAVDLLAAASAAAGDQVTPERISVLPWARGYMMAQNEAGIVLFSTTRTAQREALFQWVGPIAATRVVLLARKSDGVVINSAADISRYQTGAILDDIGEQLLRELDVAKSSVKIIPSADSLAKMLDIGRIQLWACEENVARWFIKKNQLDNSKFEVVYVLKESELYYTLNKNISPQTVQLLQQGVDAVRQDAEKYQAILDKYL